MTTPRINFDTPAEPSKFERIVDGPMDEYDSEPDNDPPPGTPAQHYNPIISHHNLMQRISIKSSTGK